jgi:integrase/recombinase XerD
MQKTLQDAHKLFTDYLNGTGKAQATVIAYTKDVEQLVTATSKKGRLNVDQVSTVDIDEFKEELKKNRYTSKSISRKINSIKAFFRYLVAQGFITENPADTISHPKFDQTQPRILTRVEYRALRDSTRGDARMYAIVELLLQTGMRISELANLQMSDLEFDRNILLISAQESRPARKVSINDAAKKALSSYLEIRPRTREKTVFLTKTCRPFLVRNIRTAIDRYFRLAGIKDAKVNDLRHTFIAEQLKAGTPLVYISQLVGHKRITTTEKYLKMIDAPELEPTIQIEQL